jgi:hypothetical protein
MAFICCCGASLFLAKIHQSQEHLWVVVTEPAGNPALCVIVNITSREWNSDPTVVLTVGDHPYVIHDSVVNYSDATLSPKQKLEEAVNNGYFSSHDPFEPTVLQRIQSGLLHSELTPKPILRYCERLWGISPTPPPTPTP